MAKATDLTGQQFGELTVIERDYDYAARNNLRTKQVYWKCCCSCGNITYKTQGHLKAGTAICCGTCGRNKNLIDLTGKTYGDLFVIEKDEEKSHKGAYWKCRCSCGNIISVKGSHLRRGEATRCRKCVGESMIIDISGQKFGKLTAIEVLKERSPRQEVMWRCKCDCGNEYITSGARLRLGMTQSCGCLCSKGELRIRQLLSENNIPFVAQKTFENCRFPKTNCLAKFDFYVNNSFLLEFDGKQHYKYEIGHPWFNSKENYEEIKARDDYKNNWAKENNIPIKRIPYYDLEKFTIEDILGDKYLIK